MEQYGDITHMIILTTHKAKDRLCYNWEEINEQIALLEESGGQGDGAVIDLTEEEKAKLKEHMNAIDDAATGGLAVYTRRADEAEAKIK